MSEPRAIDLSLDLLRKPSLASFLRERPIPADLLDLIQIAALQSDKLRIAAAEASVSERTLYSAAVLYLQEMLFFPGADCYRNLGVNQSASEAQIRLHMRWLLQWLHPDHNRDPDAVAFAQQVIVSWRTINQSAKPSAIRGARRRELKVQPAGLSRGRSRGSGVHNRRAHLPWIAIPLEQAEVGKRRFFMWLAVAFVLAAAAAATGMLVIPDSRAVAWLATFQESVASERIRVPALSERASLATPHGGAGLH